MADKYYQKAIAGGDLSALNDYGTLLAGEQRFGEAIDMFTRSAAFGDVLAPGNLIAIYVDDLEDFDSAVTFGEQYLDSSKPGVYPALADAYAHLGRFEEAENLFQQALELGAPRVHQKYAWFLWLQRNDLTGAEREFWAAHDHDEEGWSHALGYFLIDQKRIPEARAVLERGVSWGDLDASDLLDDLGRDDMK
jgi:pentatricopeptide repeat protein